MYIVNPKLKQERAAIVYGGRSIKRFIRLLLAPPFNNTIIAARLLNIRPRRLSWT